MAGTLLSSSLPTDPMLRLMALLNAWREPGPLQRVCSKDVVPDSTNREYTQLSVEHVHFIAHLMATQGFRPHLPSGDGHDIPVLCRSRANDPQSEEALSSWQQRARANGAFPRCDVVNDRPDATWYSSLGNGHFNQALNLFRLEWMSVLSFGQRWVPNLRDRALQNAIHDGVPSVVLRLETPRAVRMQISLLLNQTHRLKWDARALTGECYALPLPSTSEVKLSQFEALSKVLDGVELSSLVRTKFKVDEDEATQGYAAKLGAGHQLPARL